MNPHSPFAVLHALNAWLDSLPHGVPRLIGAGLGVVLPFIFNMILLGLWHITTIPIIRRNEHRIMLGAKITAFACFYLLPLFFALSTQRLPLWWKTFWLYNIGLAGFIAILVSSAWISDNARKGTFSLWKGGLMLVLVIGVQMICFGSIAMWVAAA